MSLKRSVKKFIKNHTTNESPMGKLYQSLINRKRRHRYEKFAELPIDDKLVIFESFMGRRYTDSPRAIYEYMLKSDRYKDYHFVWCFRDSVMANFEYLASNERTRLIRWGSEEYYRTYAYGKYWITNTRIPAAIGRREEQVYTQCWHGTPLKRLGCDIETEATESKETTRAVFAGDAMRFSYLVSTSRFYTEKMSSAFDLKRLGKTDVVIETGYPRNDALVSHKADDIERIKRELAIPEGKKVILYAPTYRENQRDENRKYQYKQGLDFHKLRESLGEDYVILFRAHYYIASEFNFDDFAGYIWDVSTYPEINDLYMVADILVTDYSSVFFDFGILRKPIIYYMYDLEHYRDELRGFYLTLDELPGPIVEEQGELAEKIITVDQWTSEKEYRNKYEAFSARFTYLEDGHATERVVERIFG
ncbi:MAG: CDP-glycerol glycerophosphotransferase family protein [Bacillota bacterium]|nr:CDP-glycerol glycerophosphotransferase family protein [Bacillota bacterium]